MTSFEKILWDFWSRMAKAALECNPRGMVLHINDAAFLKSIPFQQPPHHSVFPMGINADVPGNCPAELQTLGKNAGAFAIAGNPVNDAVGEGGSPMPFYVLVGRFFSHPESKHPCGLPAVFHKE